MERVVQGFEVVGVAILVVGSLLALGSAAVGLRGGNGRAAWRRGSTEKRPDPAVSVGDGPG
jgi:hypothetical protein